MSRLMVVNAADPEEIRIAVSDGGRLEEFYIETTSRETVVGNIYKGRVVRILQSLRAAFVDIGLPKHAFLHLSEVQGQGGGLGVVVGRRRRRRRGGAKPPVQAQGVAQPLAGVFDAPAVPPPPQSKEPLPPVVQPREPQQGPSTGPDQALKENQEVIVQVIRDSVGEKRVSVTCNIGIPGRYFVLMPYSPGVGVSKKITDIKQRDELRKVLVDINPPKNLGFIIRTAGADMNPQNLHKDLDYLVRLWKAVEIRLRRAPMGTLLYQESDLVTRTIRDVFTKDIEELHIDSPVVFNKVSDFFSGSMPRFRNRLKLYEGNQPILHTFGIDSQIELLYKREVKLPSGGTIVIEPTEALTAIDVNSGKLAGSSSAEEVGLKTNLEAAREIARQLRLRDIGGAIVVDFVDMKDKNNRANIEKTLKDSMKGDRSQTSMLHMSRFCMLEMARQKARPALRLMSFETCRNCKGTGMVRSVESTALSVLRNITLALEKNQASLEVRVDAEVAAYMLNAKRLELSRLEEKYRISITVKGMPDYASERADILPQPSSRPVSQSQQQQ